MNRDGAANQTPMTRGPRDELGLNRPNSEMRPGMQGNDLGDDVSVSATSFATSIGGQSMSIRELAKAERKAMKRARKELETALANLPAPQFEYELAAPEVITEDEDNNGKHVEIEKDAAEIEAEEIARIQKEAAELYEKRSSVVKRADLPRPIGAIVKSMVVDETESTRTSDIENGMAEDLIREEMLHLLEHDAFQFPYVMRGEGIGKKKKDKKKKKSKSNPSTLAPSPPERPLDLISDEAFVAAKELLNKEEELLIQEKRRLATDIVGSFNSDEEIKRTLNLETIKYGLTSDFKNIQKNDESVEVLQSEYNSLTDTIGAIQKQSDKIESKLKVKNGGFMKRCHNFRDEVEQSLAQIQHSKIEGKVYTSLMAHEKKGMDRRIEALQSDIDGLENMEAQLQKQYGDLLHEKKRREILIRQQENSAE